MKISYEKIYKVFLLFLTVFIGVGLLKPFLAETLSMAHVLFLSIMTLAVFLSFFLTKGKQRIIPAIITGVILLWVLLTRLSMTITFLGSYLMWIINPSTNIYLDSFQYLNIFLAAALLIPLALIMERIAKLRLAAALLLFGGLLYWAFSSYIVDKLSVCICLLFISFVLTELLQDKLFRQKIIVCLLPFLLLYMLFILLLPTRNEPYEWRAVRTIFNQVYDLVVNMSNNIALSFNTGSEGFGMEVTGFSGEARLGGNRLNWKRNEFYVTQKSGRLMAIYLRGNVFDNFNGNSWQSEADEAENEYLLDLLELVYAIERFEPGHRPNYLSYSDLNISYAGLNSNYAFAPLKLLKIDAGLALNLTHYGSEFRFDSLKRRGTEYNLTYFQVNAGQDFFKKMIIAESEYEYDVNASANIALDYHALLNESFRSLDMILKERSEKIHRQYTEKYPLSEDVRSFLIEITKDAENGYEKLKAVEQVLVGQGGVAFSYTKTPGELPEGKDFLDYFLLESHSGYCTYYATAFTLLARELGFPSRYVQGFMVYDQNLGRRPVAVNNSRAHAWTEVYFDGVGWISFEPTPGFIDNRYQYWLQTVTSNVLEESYESERAELLEQGEEALLPSVLANEEEHFSLASLFLTVIFSVLIAVLVFILIDYLMKKRRFRHYSLAEKFTGHIQINLNILHLLGFRFLPGETINEFIERISLADIKVPVNFLLLFEYYLYRDAQATSEIIATVLKDREVIFREIKQKGRWRYYYLRFKLLFR
ncbi:MAG: transglutaminase-like domain-containing protein [Lachnospiraceae bacterium]|nr:transglutaminase-like domain-containing protein [Lachnospiraceae bacterium]